MRNLAISFAAVLLAAGVARAEAVDWNAAHEHDVIEILTSDADGETRETKVWVAALVGSAPARSRAAAMMMKSVRMSSSSA
jgi:hypothetical protein